MADSRFGDDTMVALDPVTLTRFVQAMSEAGVHPYKRPYFKVWVQKWLERSGNGLEQIPSPEEFLEYLEQQGRPDWQCRQAFQAVKIWCSLEEAAPVPVVSELDDGVRDWDSVLERMRSKLLGKLYSARSVKAYMDWCRRIAAFQPVLPTNSVEASLMVQRYLEHLAVVRNLSPASIAQARNALAWLVCKEFGYELKLEDKGDAHHSKRLPTVYSLETVSRILQHCPAPWDLFFGLQYGCGLRLGELLDLRVQEIDLERQVLTVRSGKGDKDRQLPLPRSLLVKVAVHLEARRRLWQEDFERGIAKVDLPYAMARRFNGVESSWEWQHVFGSARPLRHPASKELRRWRPLETVVRDALRQAAKKAKVVGRIHPHLFRHCYATHLIEMGVPLAQVKELMGHTRIETTMIYLHVRSSPNSGLSPLDRLGGSESDGGVGV